MHWNAIIWGDSKSEDYTHALSQDRAIHQCYFLNISQVSSTWQKYLLANAKNVNRAEQQCTIEEKLAPSPVWGSEIVRRHKIAAPEMLLWILRISSQICFGFLPESYCEKVREAQDCSS